MEHNDTTALAVTESNNLTHFLSCKLKLDGFLISVMQIFHL